MSYVGTSVPRVEDGPLLTGTGCFVTTFTELPGHMWCRPNAT